MPIQPPVEFAPRRVARGFAVHLGPARMRAKAGRARLRRALDRGSSAPGPADEHAHDGVPMLDRRDEIVETSRAPPVVLRALVSAIGDGNNRPLWRSEVDRMDVQGDLLPRHEAPNDPGGRP